MASNPNKSVNDDSSFLGGGPKFNQAGMNAPLPGEKTAEAAERPPFGGPRVWLGFIVVVVLIAVLWVYYANGPGGIHSTGGQGGAVSINGAPSDNPDTPNPQ
jgi:hypothetical protein